MTTNWTGKDAGVRQPMTGETPLSPAEVGVGLREGHFNVRPVPAPAVQTSGPRRGPRSDMPELMLPIIRQAGEEGIENAELADRLGLHRWNVNHQSQTMRRLGLIHTYSTGYAIRHFDASVSVVVAKATMERLAAEKVIERRKAKRDAKQRWQVNARAKAAEQAAQEAEEARRLALAVTAEDRAAVRRQIAEARQLSEDLKRLDKQAAKPKAKASPSTRRATRNINKIADKYRGTVSVSPIPQPKQKPVAGPIDFPDHLIQRAPAKPDRWAAVQGAGVISSRIGEYEGEASPWVQAVAA